MAQWCGRISASAAVIIRLQGGCCNPPFLGGWGFESSALLFCQSSTLGTIGILSNLDIMSTFHTGKRQTGEGTQDCVDESDTFVRGANTFSDSLSEKPSLIFFFLYLGL